MNDDNTSNNTSDSGPTPNEAPEPEPITNPDPAPEAESITDPNPTPEAEPTISPALHQRLNQHRVLVKGEFKEVNSDDIWYYKDGYVYVSGNDLVFIDAKKKTTLVTIPDGYEIHYVDESRKIIIIKHLTEDDTTYKKSQSREQRNKRLQNEWLLRHIRQLLHSNPSLITPRRVLIRGSPFSIPFMLKYN